MADQHKAPLKNLSILSLETIMGYMDPGKVFELSVGSKNFYKFVESIKVPIFFIEIGVRKSLGYSIKFWNIYPSFFSKHYFFTIECISPGKTTDEVITGRINGNPFTLQKAISSGNCCYYTESFSLVEMEDISSYLLRIFKPKSFHLSLDASSAKPDSFVWKMRPSISIIKWHEISFSCNYKSVITWDNMRRVIENEEVTGLTLRVESSRQDDSEEDDGLDDDERTARDLEFHRQMRSSLLDIPKKIKCNEFDCEFFDFISVDDLINSQCKFILLNYPVTPMTNSDLNRLLKAWQKGNHLANLERLSIVTSKLTLAAMEGIELHLEDPTHPTSMKNYRRKLEGFDREEGEVSFVIKRETDNALASIIIDNHYINVRIRKNGQ